MIIQQPAMSTAGSREPFRRGIAKVSRRIPTVTEALGVYRGGTQGWRQAYFNWGPVLPCG